MALIRLGPGRRTGPALFGAVLTCHPAPRFQHVPVAREDRHERPGRQLFVEFGKLRVQLLQQVADVLTIRLGRRVVLERLCQRGVADARARCDLRSGREPSVAPARSRARVGTTTATKTPAGLLLKYNSNAVNRASTK